jgi:hypothetical protein
MQDPDSRLPDRRDELFVPCVVNCFVSGAPTVQGYAGHVKNLSSGGAGVFTTRPMIRGEPVEVVVDQQRDPDNRLYLGGVVAFCRHVKGDIYEIGIQVVVQGREPVFSRDPASRDDHLDWVVEALRASHGTGAPYRESA